MNKIEDRIKLRVRKPIKKTYMETKKLDAEQAYRTLLIIWSALLMSQFLFVLMVFFVKPELFKFDLSAPLLGESSILIILLAVIGLSNLEMAFRYKKRLLKQSVTEQNVGIVQTAMIVGCALCESISLLGLLSAFVANYQYFFVFSAVGILGTILQMPKRSNVYAASFRPRVE